MLKYEKIDFKSHGESYKYRLLQRAIFVSHYHLGYWDLFTPNGEKVASCNGKVIVVYPNYMWDGSTVIGSFYEDEVTLTASLVHDVLYNAVKNPDDIEVDFNLFKADKIFRDFLKQYYTNDGNWFQRWIFPDIYMLGLWIFGLPWKFGNNGYYKIKLFKKENPS